MQDIDDTTRPEGQVKGESNEREGILADPPVRGLVYHGVLFLGVILVLLAVNFRFTPDFLWVQWIALLWGILLAWNAWAVLSARRQTDQR